ncbi:NUDIX domain-containing protein [Paenibacillus ginsengarvi]|uniref:NUDIX hydrolase n=1 Tax=Paenibacillus ginsengarvi TaxID=400777 RepID=A0A3B0CEK5_9BACL|nr:NUDIX hydrolase [Paenibacillus ginsengarvi]RKN82147.1 NUDIX hydrolase [Paenibacillus ginsengarvi]
MLKRLVGELPNDKRIAGVHSIPVLEDGSIVLVWDRNEKTLTTVGGRLEPGESLEDALDRETVEEAGLVLKRERLPIAALYWESTDTYTVFYIARVERYVPMPAGYETTGRVTFSFETARQMVAKLEGEGLRSRLLEWAEEAASRLP